MDREQEKARSESNHQRGHEAPASSARETTTPRQWVDAAIEALRDEGYRGVRVTRLSRRLEVTSGSFYWHFRDREDLRDRVLEHWTRQLLRGAMNEAMSAGDGEAVLSTLPTILEERGLPALDQAMRDWASKDEVVARAVAKADELRREYVAQALEQAGVEKRRARDLSRLIGWAFRGAAGVTPSERLRAVSTAAAGLGKPRTSEAGVPAGDSRPTSSPESRRPEAPPSRP